MAKVVIYQTDASWHMYAADGSEPHPDNYHLIVSGDIRLGQADGVPNQATKDQQLLPVVLVHLVTHKNTRDRIG